MKGRPHKIVAPFARVALTAVLAFSAACNIGPKYKPPSAPVPPAVKEMGAPDLERTWKPAQPRDDASRGKWWEKFGDPRLNELEETLNISNQNVAAAADGVLEARAFIREARAQYFPTVAVGPNITNSR